MAGWNGIYAGSVHKILLSLDGQNVRKTFSPMLDILDSHHTFHCENVQQISNFLLDIYLLDIVLNLLCYLLLSLDIFKIRPLHQTF